MKGFPMAIMQLDNRKSVLLDTFAQAQDNFSFPGWWESLITKGRDTFEALPIPDAKTEGWRETNLAPFFNPQRKWNFIKQQTTCDEHIPEVIAKYYSPSVIWENGAINIKNLAQKDASSLNIIRFKDAVQNGQEHVIQKGLSEGQEPQHIFEALSDMFTYDGILFYLPQGVVIEEPIHVVIISSSNNYDTIDTPRLLIALDKNAQASITVHYVSSTDDNHALWVNAKEQILLGKNAHLKFLHSVQGSDKTLRFLSASARLEQDSSLNYNFLHLSGQFVRSEMDVSILGENVQTQINGLTTNRDNHFSETQQLLQHLKGYGTSRIDCRGLGKDRSKTLYRGKIYIAPHAQKSDSIQQFKGLSLSEQATIDAKPQLEIYADDVRCTHGATVGPPSPELVYYFQARGISSNKARNLLIRGFLKQVLKEFPFLGVETFVNECLSVNNYEFL